MIGTSGITKTGHAEEHITGTAPTPIASNPSQVSSNSETDPIPTSSTFTNMFFILIIFGVLASAFVWIGGVRYLTRFLPGGLQARYARVADDDLVK